MLFSNPLNIYCFFFVWGRGGGVGVVSVMGNSSAGGHDSRSVQDTAGHTWWGLRRRLDRQTQLQSDVTGPDSTGSTRQHKTVCG